MEIADVKKRLLQTVDRARRQAAERRIRTDDAERAYAGFLNHIAVPLFRQVGNVLRAEGFAFTVFTPGGSVRLMSDRAGEDYVELVLDANGGEPRVTGRASHRHGGGVIVSEHAIGDPSSLTEEDVLAFVMRELEPFVER
jgi:hypothetical protein